MFCGPKWLHDKDNTYKLILQSTDMKGRSSPRKLSLCPSEPVYINVLLVTILLCILHTLIFLIHGSVHRDSILKRSNEMQQYAGVYLLQNYSTCFGCLSHQSGGVHQTGTAASGTAHSVRVTTFRQRGLITPRWRKVVALTLRPVPEAAITV